MTHKSILQEILEQEFECRSYSGRGMCGTRCLAVILDPGMGIGYVISVLIRETANLFPLYGERDRIDQLAEQVESIRTDSMGLGTVVYFPQVKFVCVADNGAEVVDE